MPRTMPVFCAALVVCVGMASGQPAFGLRLPDVAPLPTPVLPQWIVEAAPTGQVSSTTQVRIRFATPIVPLTGTDPAVEKPILDHFSIYPAMPGAFRLVSPRIVVFDTYRNFPIATRLRVRVSAGLRDLAGDRLTKPLEWTFETEPLAIDTYWSGALTSANPMTLRANTALDVQSLSTRLKVIDSTTHAAIPVDIAVKEQNPLWQPIPLPPQDTSGPAQDDGSEGGSYTLTPLVPLQLSTTYAVDVQPGLSAIIGNVPLANKVTDYVRSVDPLSFQRLEWSFPNDSNELLFASGSVSLDFNNQVDASTLAANVTISPAPSAGFALFDNNDPLRFNDAALTPDTTYVVRIGPGVTDVNGQRLGQWQTATFNTGELAPEFAIPNGYQILPARARWPLLATGLNLVDSSLAVGSRALDVSDLLALIPAAQVSDQSQPLQPLNDAASLLPPISQWRGMHIGIPRNATAIATIPIDRGSVGLGAYAFGVLAGIGRFQVGDVMRISRSEYSGIVAFTDLGLFAQVLRENGIFRVHRLHDGSPVVGAGIELYDLASSSAASACASGTTDLDGTLIMDASAVAACIPPFSAPQLLAVAHDGSDWTFARLHIATPSNGQVWASDWPTAEFDRGGLFMADRGIYRPGETAALEAYAFFGRDGVIYRDAGSRYTIALQAPDGSITSLGDRLADADGAFSQMVSLPLHAVPGEYTITASAADGNSFHTTFNVQEFKAANYSVAVTSNADHPSAGDTVTLMARGAYSFSAPLAHGTISWHVSSKRGYYWPLFERWSYRFGREWIAPETPPSPPPLELRAAGLLDAAGTAKYAFDIPKRLPYWIQYGTDVQVSDGSDVPASAGGGALVAPAPSLIGLDARDTADPGQPIVVHVISVGDDNRSLVGRAIHLELQRQSVDAQSRVTFAPVASADTISGKDAQTVSFAGQPSGEYIVRANFAGAADNESETDAAINIPSPLSTPTPMPTIDPLQISTKNWDADVGDQQTISVKTTYPDADVFLGVVGRRLFWHRTIRVSGGSADASFTVTPEMAQASNIEAMAVRRGTDPDGATGPPGETLSALRWISSGILQRQRQFKADVRPATGTVAPGGTQTLYLALRDGDGKPVVGRFTVMVDSDDVLRVAWSSLPGMYGSTGEYIQTYTNPTAFGDNRPSVTLAPPLSPLHWPSCCIAPSPISSAKPDVWNPSVPPRSFGAISAISTPPQQSSTIRQYFRPLAYFNGVVRTDSNGRATVTFRLPDDLTTWRARVVGVPSAAEVLPESERLPFAEAEATFVARKPLMANSALPNFSRPGDRFGAGAIVTNTTRVRGNVRVNAALSGSLEFAGGSTQSAALLSGVATGDTRTYFFDVRSGAPSTARVRISAVLGHDSDEFVVPFTVLPYSTRESAVETGATSKTVRVPIALDRRSVPGSGRLDIALANSIVPDLTLPADNLMEDQDLGWLEPVESRLVAVASVQILSAGGESIALKNRLAAEAALELIRLYALQRDDGGFGWSPGSDVSDPYLSAYAAEAFARAQLAGFTPDATVVARLEQFLNDLDDHPEQWRWCLSEPDITRIRLDAMLALTGLGVRRIDHLPEVYAHRDELDLGGLARLARLLAATPGWKYQARRVFAETASLMSYTGRSVFVNLPDQWSWLDSVTVAQAELLEAAIAGSAGTETKDHIAAGLLARRVGEQWADPHATAAALAALSDYVAESAPQFGFSATAALSARRIGIVDFSAARRLSKSLSSPTESLPGNAGELALTVHGRGMLHYVVSYSYALAGVLPASNGGLRVSRTLRELDASSTPGAMFDNARATTLCKAGRLYEISVRVDAAPNDILDNVVVTENLPAGLEPVNGELASESTTLPRHDTRDYYSEDESVSRDRIVWHLSQALTGTTVTYIARAVTSGTFAWPGADAHLEFAPEEFGRSAPATLRIER